MLLNLNNHHTKDTIQPFDYAGIPIDILDDLSSRFIINLPQNERENIIRAMFQVEQAHWFYKDFVRVQRPSLPALQFRFFARIMFNHVPFLKTLLYEFDSLLEQWREYKSNVPTYGAILLDPSLEHVLMVQGFSSNSWGFPKGKVNAEEDPVLCACREVKEETGFECSKLINKDDYIELKIRDTCIRLYIIPGVKMSEKFCTQTRGEIKDIRWFSLNRLPLHKNDHDLNANVFFMAIPFIKHLRRWIQDQKRNNGPESGKKLNGHNKHHRSVSESEQSAYGYTNGHYNGYSNGLPPNSQNGQDMGTNNRSSRSRTPKSAMKSLPVNSSPYLHSQTKSSSPSVKQKLPQKQQTKADNSNGQESKTNQAASKSKKKVSSSTPQPVLSCKLGSQSWENFSIEWDKIWTQLLSESVV
ncbi:decapping mRNA 2 [Brevipalpus obovatus]|uniref:decapping mRNA 2 n=1 Tax=Brevipalpus obovatus TaxID=246614 RepID=UPI003D9F92E6